jgi:hypothetical protein
VQIMKIDIFNAQAQAFPRKRFAYAVPEFSTK